MRKITITIPKEDLPRRPRIPVYKMKKGGAHRSKKEKIEGRKKIKEKLRGIIKSQEKS